MSSREPARSMNAESAAMIRTRLLDIFLILMSSPSASKPAACRLYYAPVLVSENMVDDLPRGLFDGLVRRIDDFPAPVFSDEVPDILDLCKDFPEVAVARFEAGMFLTHPSYFLEDLGIDIETNDPVLVDFEELFGQGDARNDGDIGDLVALLREVEGGRRLGRPRESDEDDIGFLEPLGAPAVVVPERILYRVDPLEIP